MNTANAALWGSYGYFSLDGDIVMVTTNSINVIINVFMISLTFYYPVLYLYCVSCYALPSSASPSHTSNTASATTPLPLRTQSRYRSCFLA
jgi:hypothetical protein